MPEQPPWEQFERAVTQFVSALDPTAKVRHNVRLPDIDTGEPRQRDVWIEAKVCKHYPVKLLISCKHTAEPLDSQDLDAFIGELRSSGANKGVLYSLSGYTGPALRKAEKVGLTCCRLYQNEPADLPSVLLFWSYCCTPRIQIAVDRLPDPPIVTYNDLFRLEAEDDGGHRTTVLDIVNQVYFEGESEVRDNISLERRLPAPWNRAFQIRSSRFEPLTVIVRGTWKVWRGKLEAHLVAGSYAFDTGEFIGTQYGPVVDTHEPPGPGWELLEGDPSTFEPCTSTFIFYGGDTRDLLIQSYGAKVIADDV